MARTERITCDVCGKDKGEGNHWFTILTNDDCIGAVLNSRQAENVSISDGARRFDLCGESCVLKKVSELIGKAAV